MVNKLYFIFFFLTISLTAQVKGVVKDSISGKPIPYVNIWVENENIGTTSEEDGSFSLEIKEEKKIVFSALAYEVKTISSKDITTVLLVQKTYEMPEILVTARIKTKEIEIGDAEKIHHSQLSGDKPWIFAKLFEFEEKYNETPFIKEIVFISNNNIKNAKLKIRVFSMNDSIPSDDLLSEDIIVTVKKGMKKNKVDISKYNLEIPKEGILIGLEWLIIDENKYDFVYKEKKKKKSFITYAPSLVINYTDKRLGYTFQGGKWFRNRKYTSKNFKEIKNKAHTPAINLILTN